MAINHSISIADVQEPEPAPEAISEEERGRADIYRLLALFLDRPPSQDILDMLKNAQPDASDLGVIVTSLGTAASKLSKKQIEEEFTELFVGAPMARFMPYASYYTNGQLFGRALAELRMDLGRYGIARREDATEPEDHIATLFEIMSGLLIDGFQDSPLSLHEQARFFSKHIAPWTPRFFDELEKAKGSEFYVNVARFGRRFIELETEAFRMI